MTSADGGNVGADGGRPLLVLENLSAAIGTRRVLRDVHLEVQRGEIHALVGGRGAGKSSLVKVISGCLPRASGAIRFEGRAVERHTPQNALRLGITTLHQEDRLLPEMNACENVFLNREIRRLGVFSDKRRMREATARAFRSIPLAVDPDLPVRFYDSNTQQLILISRIFCFPSRLVVLDEVAGRLTPGDLERLHYLLSVLRQNGVTILYVASDLDEVANFATRVSILEGGTVARTARASNLDEDRLVRLTHASLFSRQKLESSNLELYYLNYLNQNILDNIPVPILVADSKGAVMLANRALLELSRLSREELLRAGTGELLPEAAGGTGGGHEAAAQDERRLTGRQPPFLREGLRVDILVSPLVDPDGASMGTVFLFSSPGGQAAAAREPGTRSRPEELRYLAEMSHEINNPLGILLNYLELIRSSGSLEQVHADAEVMGGELRRIKRTLSRYMRSRTDGDGRTEERAARRTASVREAVAGVMALLQLKGEAAGAVQVEMDGDPRLEVEPDLLRQVILNVAMNGIESMPAGGPLAIRVAPTESAGRPWVAIEVRDEGVGIPEEDLERIFEPFFTTKGDPQTRGLGLSLSRDIVSRYGGSIEVESRPGRGSTFRIRLPLVLPT